jgi:NAD(P)-dependent dehydrogenase (short-subunit alcohol dehydrogenase family)
MDVKQMTHYEAAPGLLAERVILVTGAGAGIGRALAKAAAAWARR